MNTGSDRRHLEFLTHFSPKKYKHLNCNTWHEHNKESVIPIIIMNFNTLPFYVDTKACQFVVLFSFTNSRSSCWYSSFRNKVKDKSERGGKPCDVTFQDTGFLSVRPVRSIYLHLNIISVKSVTQSLDYNMTLR